MARKKPKTRQSPNFSSEVALLPVDWTTWPDKASLIKTSVSPNDIVNITEQSNNIINNTQVVSYESIPTNSNIEDDLVVENIINGNFKSSPLIPSENQSKRHKEKIQLNFVLLNDAIEWKNSNESTIKLAKKDLKNLKDWYSTKCVEELGKISEYISKNICNISNATQSEILTNLKLIKVIVNEHITLREIESVAFNISGTKIDLNKHIDYINFLENNITDFGLWEKNILNLQVSSISGKSKLMTDFNKFMSKVIIDLKKSNHYVRNNEEYSQLCKNIKRPRSKIMDLYDKNSKEIKQKYIDKCIMGKA